MLIRAPSVPKVFSGQQQFYGLKTIPAGDFPDPLVLVEISCGEVCCATSI
jgi:hypothetical protein